MNTAVIFFFLFPFHKKIIIIIIIIVIVINVRKKDRERKNKRKRAPATPHFGGIRRDHGTTTQPTEIHEKNDSPLFFFLILVIKFYR